MELGPHNASLVVKTYREGVAAKAGHDLVIEVERWEATVDVDAGRVELSADPRSLAIREGLRGVKPLTDRDRREIRKNIDEKVLGGQPIAFRSSSARVEGGQMVVDGELTMAGASRPVRAVLEVDAGRAKGTVPLRQSEWGIKPYRGLMGALKVRDDVEIVIDAPLPG
jgi:polyisoprenoid-binding protein YceI